MGCYIREVRNRSKLVRRKGGMGWFLRIGINLSFHAGVGSCVCFEFNGFDRFNDGIGKMYEVYTYTYIHISISIYI